MWNLLKVGEKIGVINLYQIIRKDITYILKFLLNLGFQFLVISFSNLLSLYTWKNSHFTGETQLFARSSWKKESEEKVAFFLTFCPLVDLPYFIQGEKLFHTEVLSTTLLFSTKVKTERKDNFCYRRSSKNWMERERIIKWFVVSLLKVKNKKNQN